MGATNHSSIVIIGGGIAGLSCAVALSDHGFPVTVLEAADQLGGRARSLVDGTSGDVVDLGPHIVFSEYRNMLALLGTLGTREQLVWQTDKFITLVDEPRPAVLRMDALPPPLPFVPSLLAVPQLSLLDMASNVRVIWRAMRCREADFQRLDGIDAESFLRRSGVSKRSIDWSWRTAAMTIMNVPLERCSAGAVLRFFRFVIGSRGFRVGFAGSGLGELFVPAARARIEAAGGAVRCQSEAVGLIGDERMDAVQMADGSRLKADVCVAAVPPQSLHPLLSNAWCDRDAGLAHTDWFEASPYISTYLWFDRKLTRECFWSRVWGPDRLNYDTYDLSNIRHGWQQRPSLIASNIIHSHGAEAMSDAAIIETTLRELAGFLPEIRQAQLLHSRVHRIPMAIPAPHPGIEQRRPPSCTAISGLYLAGDWTRTGLPQSMESAARSGFLAAEQVLASLGRPTALAAELPAAQGLVRMVGGP